MAGPGGEPDPAIQTGRRVMTILSEVRGLFDEWVAAVAGAVDAAIGRYARRPRIVLAGESTGVLTARLQSTPKGQPLADVSFRIANGRPSPALPADWQAAFRGSRIETHLASGQVLFRPLDFPKQAVDFLDGMIRTQIDRLTPWPADDAVFGWSAPSETGQDRIELMLAATSKQEIEPLVQLAANLGAQSLVAFASAARRGRVHLLTSGFSTEHWAVLPVVGSIRHVSCAPSCCRPALRLRSRCWSAPMSATALIPSSSN